MARRFIVNDNDIMNINDNTIEIIGSEVKHIQVLRHDVNDSIIVNDLVCKITKMKKDSISLEIIRHAVKVGEPHVNVTLYVALLKTDKLDLIVQKATELGVKYIVPFISKNVIVKLDDKGKIKRQEKLQMIANEACKQCGRTDTVQICNIIDAKLMLDKLNKHEITIFAYEKETDLLGDILKNEISDISLIIGPEGGFDITEVNNISKVSNVKSISLGKRILRAETAAISLISIVMHGLGEM